MNLSTPDHLAVVDHLLTTTRSVRKRLDFDRPVPSELIQRCLEIATQAPSGSNRQGWHFLVITDPAKRQHWAISTAVPSTSTTGSAAHRPTPWPRPNSAN